MPQEPNLPHLLETKEHIPLHAVDTPQPGIDNPIDIQPHDQPPIQQLEAKRGHAILSPVEQVPLEIFEQIFVLLLPALHLDTHGRKIVIDLGLVSNRWREATLQAHQLWRGLHIKPKSLSYTGYSDIVTWLQRAGDLPKSVKYKRSTVRCPCRDDESDSDEDTPNPACTMTNKVLIKLLSTGPRLDHLTLALATIACYRNWTAALSATKPSDGTPRPWDTLRSLDLTFSDCREGYWDDSNDPPRSIFCRLPPTITSFHLRVPTPTVAFSNEWQSEMVPLRIPFTVLNRLTNLEFHSDWEGHQIIDILRHCHSLETLTVDFGGAWCQLGSVKERISLPRLHTFRLFNAVLFTIFDHLDTPSLRELEVNHIIKSDDPTEAELADDPIQSILEFLSRRRDASGRAEIDCLRIMNSRILSKELFGLLFATQVRVGRLVLDKALRSSSTEAFLSKWVTRKSQEMSNHQECLLQSVKHLELLRVPFQHPSNHFLELLWGRISPGTTIEVSYTGSQPPDPQRLTEDGDCARRLREAGGFLRVYLPM